MTNTLTLLTQEEFGGMKLDFYQNEQNEVFMTIAQLSSSLGYASKSAIENMLKRNPILKEDEFSTTHSLWVGDINTGKTLETRVFTEDGIYEVTMLSKQPKAQEFRQFVRKLLKGLRKGEMQVVQTEVFSYMIDDPATRARMWADEMDGKDELIAIEKEKQVLLTNTIEEYKPKVEVYEQAMSFDKLQSMKEVAHLMDIGRNTLFAKLRDAGILNGSNLPYQRFISSKYFTVKQVTKVNGVYNTTLVTQKGLDWLIRNKEAIMNSTFTLN